MPQALFAPDSLHLLVVYPPSFGTEHYADLAIAVAAVLLGQPDHKEPQCIIISRGWSVLQGAPRQTDHSARPPLGRAELLTRVNDQPTQIVCRQPLGFKIRVLLEKEVIQFKLRNNNLEPAVLIFESLPVRKLGSPHAAKLLAPIVTGLVTDPCTPAGRRHVNPSR